MHKFITLKVGNLRLDNLAGLVVETIDLATPQTAALGAVGAAKLQALTAASDKFVAPLNKSRASLLTPQIREKDQLCGKQLAEIKRLAKVAQQSSVEATAAAGTKMVDLLKPFWNISKEPLMSQTTQIDLLAERYAADPEAVAAATTLGLAPFLQNLFAANAALLALYNERLDEMAAAKGPSASSLKRAVVMAYDAFCAVVEMTLPALPSDALQLLFNEMNDIRRKYVSRLPAPLNGAHTSVAPIDPQPCTGRAVTPLPRVFYKTNKETRELTFARDFTVTYRNNVKVGEAKLLVHGKGKYSGTCTITFHIVNPQGAAP
jgi:hypothetical protein